MTNQKNARVIKKTEYEEVQVKKRGFLGIKYWETISVNKLKSSLVIVSDNPLLESVIIQHLDKAPQEYAL